MQGFFDKVTGGINKGVASVSANSKAMLEKSKINSAIVNLEKERKQLTHLLGQRVYDNFKASGEVAGDQGIMNFFAEIDKRLELILVQEEQLRRIEEELAMVTKGTVPIARGDAVCQCGHANVDDARFCAGCGTKI